MRLVSGFSNMHMNEWYRLFTGSFFHANIVHLVGNILAMYFIGSILENNIGSLNFLIIFFISDMAESIAWSNVFASAKSGCGASAGIFALIACMLILYLNNQSLLNLRPGTWKFDYTVGYFFLANFWGLSSLIAHSLGFSFGIVVSMVLLLSGML